MITHRPPVSIETDLYSPIHASSAIPQSNAAMRTSYYENKRPMNGSNIPSQSQTTQGIKLTWDTLNSSIIWVGAVTCVTIIGTVDQSGLSCCTSYIIESYNDIWVLSKMCTAKSSCVCKKTKSSRDSCNKMKVVLSLTRARIAKLSTGHIGINCCPQMITHRPPVSIQTHLYSPI